MPVDFRDRASRILNHAKREFGEDAMLYPEIGDAFEIRGIFDNEYQSVDPDTEQVISATQPVFGVNLFDFNFEINVGDKLKIRNIFFNIIDKRPDGQGGASLILHRCDHGQKVFKKKGDSNP